jgi:hypothetical protein
MMSYYFYFFKQQFGESTGKLAMFFGLLIVVITYLDPVNLIILDSLGELSSVLSG